MNKLLIEKNKNIKNAFRALNVSGYKCLVVVDNKKSKLFLGTLSDGDLRRALLKKFSLSTKIEKIINKKAQYIFKKDYSSGISNKLISKFKINIIPIVDDKKKIIKILKFNPGIKTKKIKKTITKIKKIKNIPLVVMAGGLGKRLDPFTQILPKALMPINKKTIIENIIEKFIKYGTSNVFISINFKAELIKAYFSKLKKKFNIKFVEENFPTGTVGSLKFLLKEKYKNFIVSNCDVLLNIDLSKFTKFHLANNYDLTLVCVKKRIKLHYGVCKVDTRNKLVSFNEKPNLPILTNAGVYIIKKEIINLIPDKRKYDINELIDLLSKKGKNIGAYKINEKSWVDVGQMVDYRKNIKKIYE